MAKKGGRTRNYGGKQNTLQKRLNEYHLLLATGDYDVSRSLFDNSGGFIATNKEHNLVVDSNEDKSEFGTRVLASKGYRLYLDGEKTTISDNGKKKDGRIEKSPMDIKTINVAGRNTIKGAVESAIAQGAKTVILVQNTPDMTIVYVKEQLYGKNGVIMKSPLRVVSKVEWVIVVGMKGTVHRHNLIEERSKRL